MSSLPWCIITINLRTEFEWHTLETCVDSLKLEDESYGKDQERRRNAGDVPHPRRLLVRHRLNQAPPAPRRAIKSRLSS
jgi:hypothetical protein